MARTPKPWYRKDRNSWFVTLRGKQHDLGKDKKAAYERFHELMVKPPEKKTTSLLASVFELFLEWCHKNRPDSYQWYQYRINDFAKLHPSMTIENLKPYHVQEWIDSKNKSGYKRGCVVAVNRALSWAVKQGRIAKNPIEGMEKPKATRRSTFITQEQFNKILQLASDHQFRDLLTFIWETGCRPQEAFKLEKRHVQLVRNTCVFTEEESKGKIKRRVIYLTDAAKDILHRLSSKYEQGRLLRNADGEPWKANNIACRFKRMAKKLGFHACLYELRHGFCTRLLKAGIDPITVATLAGHNDTAMLARIYSHIQNDNEHLLKALAKGQ